jgi:hypothetical protein
MTIGHYLRVDVKQAVVVLGGTVSTPMAKLAAEHVAWQTLGVVDVSNQLRVISEDQPVAGSLGSAAGRNGSARRAW